ncbi:hypothetical protein PC123_g27772 [Phytophthora cactorum]|nr:hypothetical protein PC123_g27772 [Phytophthora cactorum]
MNAAATDIVSPDYRATAFDLLSVSIVVGYCSSAFMAPFFARENILQISGGIFILRVVWAIAIVSETLPARTYTNKTRWTAENPISSISILNIPDSNVLSEYCCGIRRDGFRQFDAV